MGTDQWVSLKMGLRKGPKWACVWKRGFLNLTKQNGGITCPGLWWKRSSWCNVRQFFQKQELGKVYKEHFELILRCFEIHAMLKTGVYALMFWVW